MKQINDHKYISMLNWMIRTTQKSRLRTSIRTYEDNQTNFSCYQHTCNAEGYYYFSYSKIGVMKQGHIKLSIWINEHYRRWLISSGRLIECIFIWKIMDKIKEDMSDAVMYFFQSEKIYWPNNWTTIYLISKNAA